MRRMAAGRGQNRNIAPCRALAFHIRCREGSLRKLRDRATTREHDDRIVETPTEARQAEPGPSVLALLTVSTGLAVLILGIIWFVFLRT